MSRYDGPDRDFGSYVQLVQGQEGWNGGSCMKIARIGDVEAPDASGLLARPFLEGDQSNVRVIRVAAGHALPPHRHATSDLMLYVVAGDGELDTSDSNIPFGAGSLAFYRGDEELRVRNAGQDELMMLAFLTPKFAAS